MSRGRGDAVRYGGCGKEAERVTTEQQYFPGTSSAAAAAEGRQDRATDRQGDERVRIGMIRDVGRVCVRFQSSVADAARKAQWNRTRKAPSFVDTLQIYAEGGTGGDGCIAFERAKFQPYGPPSGGAGGAGGSIRIQASPALSSLARISSRVVGGRGEHGLGDWQSGKAGRDKLIQVPIGTVVTVQTLPCDADSLGEKQSLYHKAVMSKYRNTYLRERRRRSLPIPSQKLNPSALESRAQREAAWRYYPGAVLPASSVEDDAHVSAQNATDEDTNSDEDTRSDNVPGQNEEEVDADSDIRILGHSFRESEKRLAFWLWDQTIRDASENARKMAQWKATWDDEGAGPWTVDLDGASMDTLVLVNGGRGGLGNSYFSSGTNRSPTSATRGLEGTRALVSLEWKFKGDVGLIGLPNAGKSTFLKSVSSAGDDVRIADYAFTTLTPNVGVVRLSERGLMQSGTGDVVESESVSHVVDGNREYTTKRNWHSKEQEVFRFTLQDLPGLVEGAADNRGLGHDFLKHIERCTALYYVVDVSSKDERLAQPWRDVSLVHAELEQYRPGLSDKVRGVIANKCDKLDGTNPEERDVLRQLRDKVHSIHGRRVPVYNISAKERKGVETVVKDMASAVDQSRKQRLEATVD